MFTGLVEESGTVVDLELSEASVRLKVESALCSDDLKIGDSLAVNGACLTVVQNQELASSRRVLSFDILNETMKRTNFHEFQIGSLVNLERAVRLSDRLGGHMVSGHIDEVADISVWEARDDNFYLELRLKNSQNLKYLIEKGSIALDGISLTVAGVDQVNSRFWVWIIPHTREVTNLHTKSLDSQINVEFDQIGKYVENFVRFSAQPTA